jgi:hypothetical protein
MRFRGSELAQPQVFQPALAEFNSRTAAQEYIARYVRMLIDGASGVLPQ